MLSNHNRVLQGTAQIGRRPAIAGWFVAALIGAVIGYGIAQFNSNDTSNGSGTVSVSHPGTSFVAPYSPSVSDMNAEHDNAFNALGIPGPSLEPSIVPPADMAISDAQSEAWFDAVFGPYKGSALEPSYPEPAGGYDQAYEEALFDATVAPYR